jgi:integrase/recombinase XerD
MASRLPSLPACGPADQLLCSYTHYLHSERCLTQSCVHSYGAMARKFLQWRFGDNRDDIATLKAQEVTSFALRATRIHNVGMAKLVVTPLRSFLRYLYLQGHVSVDFRGALPAIAGWRRTGLRKALPASQIRALLDSCDRRQHDNQGAACLWTRARPRAPPPR